MAAVEYLSLRTEVDEVILSGGDPLMLTDATLAKLVGLLERVPHVRRLRMHTRLPIMIPGRVQMELLEWLSSSRLVPIVVVHVNHPREIDAHVGQALLRLVGRGIPVLNQTVLLRGINDRAEVLIELCRTLVNHRVMPYYLHQLDPVRGAAHFGVPIHEGRALMARLREALPGYAVPRYVQEIPGEASKRPIT
jgi:KamA family protein